MDNNEMGFVVTTIKEAVKERSDDEKKELREMVEEVVSAAISKKEITCNHNMEDISKCKRALFGRDGLGGLGMKMGIIYFALTLIAALIARNLIMESATSYNKNTFNQEEAPPPRNSLRLEDATYEYEC